MRVLALRPWRFLTATEVAALFGISRPTLWRWRQDPSFPRAVKTPTGGIRFIETEIAAYQQRLAEAR